MRRLMRIVLRDSPSCCWRNGYYGVQTGNDASSDNRLVASHCNTHTISTSSWCPRFLASMAACLASVWQLLCVQSRNLKFVEIKRQMATTDTGSLVDAIHSNIVPDWWLDKSALKRWTSEPAFIIRYFEKVAGIYFSGSYYELNLHFVADRF